MPRASCRLPALILVAVTAGCGATALPPIGDGGGLDFSVNPNDLSGGESAPDLSRPDLAVPGCLNDAQCAGLPNATGVCGPERRCIIGSCNAGFADCDKAAATGCEAALASDGMNCGACGTACAFANAAGSCVAGKCQLGDCSAGFANCDALPLNGCEVATTSDVLNCGGCGRGCVAPNATPGCMNSQCVLTACSPGFADCNQMFVDGCEARLATDPTNCGGCMKACMMPANGTAACAQGMCTLAMCNAGFGDCDKDPQNGCEVALATDVKNCGGCNMACNFPNAVPACTNGLCALASCNMLFGDCDKNAVNGCEKSLAADLQNCGACGAVCARANAVAACLGGQCGIGSCNAGFGDCNGNGADGCETSLVGDGKNCGKCGTVCPQNAPACVNGVCAPQCKVGFAPRVDFLTGTSPMGMALLDVNGDGRLDAVTPSNAGTSISVHLGTGNNNPFFANAVTYQVGASPYSVASGDFDGDGRIDLAVPNVNGNTVSILLNNNNLGFKAALTVLTGSSPAEVAVADYNGDNRLDLAVVNSGGNNVSVHPGNGPGTFGAAVNYAVGLGPFALAAGDVNGDNKPDIVVANTSATTVSVLMNAGNGLFAQQVTYTVRTSPRAVALADLNGDGSLDLAVANRDSNDVSVLTNKGNGTFNAAMSYLVGTTPRAIAVRDMNLDGRPDIVTPGQVTNNVSVLVNAGNAAFLPQVTFTTALGPWGLGVGDVNGDNKPDVVTSNYDSSTISLLISTCN